MKNEKPSTAPIPCPMLALYKRKKERMIVFLQQLAELFPEPACELIHSNAFELICATILSAQCTDKQVNKVTPSLFATYPTAYALANADMAELEAIIHSTGFYKNKAKNLIGMALAITNKHNGVPNTLDELIKLPGVGRKTANVVLGNAYGIPGMVVDTHVIRITNKLGFVSTDDPVKIEHELEKLVPKSRWVDFSHQVILLGRSLCAAKKTRCEECPCSRVG